MKDEELEQKAKELLEQVEDVLVDVGVSGCSVFLKNPEGRRFLWG